MHLHDGFYDPIRMRSIDFTAGMKQGLVTDPSYTITCCRIIKEAAIVAKAPFHSVTVHKHWLGYLCHCPLSAIVPDFCTRVCHLTMITG